MDAAREIGEFLTSRRARLTPEQVGLRDFGGRRRVTGLRREEVAMVAGISVQYYTRFERGTATTMSDSVLAGLSRALLLDEVETTHLADLVRAAQPATTRPPGSRPLPAAAGPRVRAGVQQMLDAMKDLPAIVQNGRLDVVATNPLGAAFYSQMLDTATGPANFARFIFLDPAAEEFYRNWADVAEQTASLLRNQAGKTPTDRRLSNLVGELSTQSGLFRTLWARHTVRDYRTGFKRVHHPVVGDLDVTFESMEIASQPDLMLIAYTATPGSPSHDNLRLLATWAATQDQAGDNEADATPLASRQATSPLDLVEPSRG